MVAELDDHGIIPAGAGRRPLVKSSSRAARDHPRGCGEKHITRTVEGGYWGSSPRVRGEARRAGGFGETGGIIPAGAGRRSATLCSLSGARDHPRGCGEKHGSVSSLVFAKGSSPRVRGEGVSVGGHVFKGGIIPAGAGRSPPASPSSPPPRDHPRGCGEKSGLVWKGRCNTGSSPRVRGEAGRS